jgi:DNA-binding CsgD family transcriptional regulator
VFIKRVSEFISFLSLREHELEEVLSHLVHRVLVDLGATSVFVSSLNPKNEVEMVGQFGMDPELWKVYPQGTSIFDKYPITDALRNRKTIWINTLPNWGDEYPLLKPYTFPGQEKTFICFAIEKCGTPVAVMGFFAMPTIELDAEIDAFVGTIANLLSLYLYRHVDSPSNLKVISSKPTILKNNVQDQKLTERQLLILRMISENRTNILISELLGYSESTIRQETIKIYAKLGCNGREEAARIYRETMKDQESAVN